MALNMSLGLGLSQKAPSPPTMKEVQSVSDNLQELAESISEGAEIIENLLGHTQDYITNDFMFNSVSNVRWLLENIG